MELSVFFSEIRAFTDFIALFLSDTIKMYSPTKNQEFFTK